MTVTAARPTLLAAAAQPRLQRKHAAAMQQSLGTAMRLQSTPALAPPPLCRRRRQGHAPAQRTAVVPQAARGGAAAAKAAAAATAAAAAQQQTLVSQLFAGSTVYALAVAALVRSLGLGACLAWIAWAGSRAGAPHAAVLWDQLTLLSPSSEHQARLQPSSSPSSDGARPSVGRHAPPAALAAGARPTGACLRAAAGLVLAARHLFAHPARQLGRGLERWVEQSAVVGWAEWAEHICCLNQAAVFPNSLQVHLRHVQQHWPKIAAPVVVERSGWRQPVVPAPPS